MMASWPLETSAGMAKIVEICKRYKKVRNCCMVTVGIERKGYLQEVLLKENYRFGDMLTVKDEEFSFAHFILDR
jgi:hypothetical protein